MWGRVSPGNAILANDKQGVFFSNPRGEFHVFQPYIPYRYQYRYHDEAKMYRGSTYHPKFICEEGTGTFGGGIFTSNSKEALLGGFLPLI